MFIENNLLDRKARRLGHKKAACDFFFCQYLDKLTKLDNYQYQTLQIVFLSQM